MGRQWEWCLRSACVLGLVSAVMCGPNLCQNGAKLDTITFIDTTKQWFFTSGGHYWIEKESDFPPRNDGTPLPGGFQKGDASFLKNTLDACGKGEQEIHVIEQTPDGNKVLVYDIRQHTWAPKTMNYNEDKGIAQAKVDWRQPIDAAFAYKKTKLFLLQQKKYAVVDISGLCKDPNGYGNGSAPQDISDLNVQTGVDATATLGDGETFYLFQDQTFWKIDITRLKDGKANTRKNIQQDVVTEFFKYKEKCVLPPQAGKPPPPPPPKAGPVGGVDSQPKPQPPPEETPHAAEEDQGSEEHKEEESGSGSVIIIVVIIVIVILLALVLIACLTMRKKSKEGGEESGLSGASGSRVGGSSAASSGSKLGHSPSANSVRSNTALSPKSASKTGSKTDSKTGGVSPQSSSLGTSPSTMSVRSKTA